MKNSKMKFVQQTKAEEQEAKRPCPRCKGKVYVGDKYCGHCGRRRMPGPAPKKRCMCGTMVRRGDLVCPDCEETSPWARID